MKENIESLFRQNVEAIKKHYGKDESMAIKIAEAIIVSRLEESVHDSCRESFIEFSNKFLPNYEFYEYRDFSITQIKQIISETPLTERDRRLAMLRYIELKSEEEIADILYIDKKTVHTNIPKISMCLKKTAKAIFG